MADEKHPTWNAIPAEYRSEWYRVPGFTHTDRRGAVYLAGSGLSAQSDIPGICKAGDRFAPGEIVPFRLFDHAARQGRLGILLRPKPTGHGIEAVTPHPAELEALYERFPAMRPVEPEKPKKVVAKNTTQSDDEEGAE